MEYRVYTLGRLGQIVARHDFEADDDAAAMDHARYYATNCSVEVWQLGRRVGEIKQPE